MKRYLAGMVVALSVLLGASTLPAAEPEVLEVFTPEIRTLTQHLEPDPAASTGIAARCIAGEDVPGYVFGAYDRWPPPGRYEFIFRLRCGEPIGEGPICEISNAAQTSVVSIPSIQTGVEVTGAKRKLHYEDFPADGSYQDFSIVFDVVEHCQTAKAQVRWYSTADLWIDSVTYKRHALFSDRDLWEALPNKPSGYARLQAGPGSAILVVKGLWYERHRFDQIARLLPNTRWGEAWITGGRVEGFPESYEEMNQWATVVLANAGAYSLTLAQRRILSDWVRAGGRLVILGGPWTLGKGKFENTFLERLLPVSLSGPWNLKMLPRPAALVPNPDCFSQLRWEQGPLTLAVEPLAPRPRAQVLVRAGDRPAIVTRPYHRGRVAVVPLATMGLFEEEELPFYDWPDWPVLLSQLMTQ